MFFHTDKTELNYAKSKDITKYILYSLTHSHFNAIVQSERRIIIDTGASVSATSDESILTNVRPCKDMTALPAFGPKIDPKMRGDFGTLGLDTLVIDKMSDTLLSVSQICKGGQTNDKHVAVFTAEGSRIFELE